MNVALGPFQLEEMLGQGGMGEVWLARHDRQGVQVAVKLITESRATQPRYHTAFRAEIQAMAKLHHPGIALVLDYGRVSRRAAEQTRGRFCIDAPYLAMELADGSLGDYARTLDDWPAIREVLLQVLDGLAHAHARGLIHRDIKPQNILVVEGDSPAYKLADFGLARTLDDEGEGRGAAGTPKYMAPEQIVADVREQGPWTDLYALGCVAHWLVSGQPPYAFEESEEIFRGHLMEPLPPLSPRLRVPAQFEQWLQLMLAKEPRSRFRGAADARWALQQVDDGTWVGLDHATDDELIDEEMPATVVEPSSPSTDPAGYDDTTLAEPSSSIVAVPPKLGGPEHSPVAPPMPEHWRRPEHPLASMRLVGAGLGLYGLRPIPMVDRDVERDAIWEELRAVRGDGGVRTVVLEGTAGAGKTRIAEWMTERVHETGAGRVFRAGHGPIEGAADGLGRMVAATARVVAAERPEVLDRLQKLMSPDGSGREFDAYDVFALADIAQGAGQWVENSTPQERYGVIARFLRRGAPDRPAVVWLDDVQWGAESLGFVQYLHEADESPDCLFVLTVRSEALVERPTERHELRQLSKMEGVRSLEVSPLSRHDHRQLVARMLRLGDELAQKVVERTEGNPLFAVQLVGDWVERELLVVGDDGFEVADPDAIQLPDSIHKLWSRRIDRAVRRFTGRTTIAGQQLDPDDVVRSLEVAAALGQEVDYNEWMVACAEAELDASLRLVEELGKLRLGDRTPTGWRFSHGMLAESLQRRAQRRGRLADNHAACARMLQKKHGLGDAAHRIAEHLLVARRWEEALEPLLVAAEQTARRGEFEAALRLDDQRDAAMDELGLPDDDPRRIIGEMRRTRTLQMLSRYDEARELIERAEDRLEDGHPDEVSAAVWWAHAGLLRHLNETKAGIEYAERARDAYQRAGDVLGVARCHKRLGELQRRLGDLPRSIESYQKSIELLEALDEPWERSWGVLGLGTSERHGGRIQSAKKHIEDARDLFEEIGNRLGLGNAYNELGELARSSGRFEEAARYYERALGFWERRKHTDLGIIRYNLALTHLFRRQFEEAEPLFADVHRTADERGYRVLVMFCAVALACCRAADGDEEAMRRHYEQFSKLQDDFDLIEPDIAELAQLLGTIVADEHPEIARDAFERALEQHRALGNEERIRNVNDMMATLTT